MQFQTIAASALSVLAATASAAAVAPRQAPPPEPIPAGAAFKLLSLRSASPVHFRYVDAGESRLWLNYGGDKPACDAETDGNAQFRLIDGEIYLYRTSATPQQLWVDRSGMGQGVTGYTTGVEPIVRNGERGPFVLDEYNNLSLDGSSGFLACPSGDSYRIWTNAGVTAPAGIEGCLGVSLRAVPVTEPYSCLYSQQQPVV